MVQGLRETLLWWWENRPHKDSEHVFTVHGGRTSENQHGGKRFHYRQHFMRKLCDKAGVKPFGFHAIRHLTASLLDMAGKELTIIQGVLRHQNPHTTARYLHSGAMRRNPGHPVTVGLQIKSGHGRSPPGPLPARAGRTSGRAGSIEA